MTTTPDARKVLRAVHASLLISTLLLASALIAGCSDEPAPGAAADAATDVDPATIDLIDPTCTDTAWTAPTMPVPLTAHVTQVSADHTWEPEIISYAAHPPSSGAHRPSWAKWGHYSYLPPQRWLHNLEHGGIALLYHPCSGTAIRDKLLEFARTSKPNGQKLLWVLTPYPELPAAMAVVAWEETLLAETFDAKTLEAFVQQHHRTAPEDVAATGQYDLQWIEE